MLATSLLVVVLFVQYYQAVRVALINEANQKLYAAASHTAANLDAFIQTNLYSCQSIAQFEALEDLLALPPDQRPGSEEQGLVMNLLSLMNSSPWDQFNMVSFALLDADGINIADTGRSNMGMDESGSSHFHEALRTGLAYVSPVEFAADVGGVFMSISAPVRRDGVGAIVGVIRMRFSVSTLQHTAFQSRGLAGEQSHAIVFDENMVRLADDTTSEQLFRAVAPLSPGRIAALRTAHRLPNWPDERLSSNLPDLADGLASGQANDDPFFEASVTPGGEPRQIAVARMSTRPWTVAFVQPQDVFLAPIDSQTRRVVVLSAALLVGVLALIIAVARWLTRPIARLTAVAEHIAAGDLTVEADIESEDEIGVLARTFNKMTAELRMSFEMLEARVADRTRDLSLANDQLQAEIHERERIEQSLREYTLELERRNEELDAYAHTVAHDLKNPLGVITGYAVLLQDIVRDAAWDSEDDLARSGLEMIAQSSEKMVNIIDELLLLASIRQAEVELEPVDMAALVHAVQQRMLALSRERDAQLTLPDAWPCALGYGPWIEEVLANYVSNAIKYGGTPPIVALGAEERPDGTVRFWVRDNGSGLAPEEQARLFKPFTQLDRMRAKGSGLGLSIARRIMDRLGGEVAVSSTMGEGSEFSFILPAATQQAGESGSEPRREPVV